MTSHNIKEILINEIDALHKEVKDIRSSLERTNSLAMIALTGSAVAANVGTTFSIGVATGIIASIGVGLTAIPFGKKESNFKGKKLK